MRFIRVGVSPLEPRSVDILLVEGDAISTASMDQRSVNLQFDRGGRSIGV